MDLSVKSKESVDFKNFTECNVFSAKLRSYVVANHQIVKANKYGKRRYDKVRRNYTGTFT